jgi:hypothetical protein
VVNVEERLDYIGKHDPAGLERLKRLLERKSYLLDSNVYGERFTERQFDLVFNPLMRAAYDRARILEALSEKDNTVPVLSERLELEAFQAFDYMKDLLKNNQVEVAGFDERNPIFRRK